MSANQTRMEAIVGELPEWERVDIEAWGGEPTFRVRNKNFVFTNTDFTHLTVKLPKDEARAVVASDDRAEPCGYGLGRHGWVSVAIGTAPTDDEWTEIREWVRTSYTMVAPKTVARAVLADDGLA